MKHASILLAVCCCLSAVSGQWLERIVYLPDSLCAVPGPQHIVYNRANQTVYVAGDGLGVVAIAGSTGRKEAVIDVGARARAMCCDPVPNRVYVATWNMVVVIDGSSISILRDSAGGVEESFRPQAPSRRLAATVIRSLPPGAVAFDAMGRRVMNPKPGIYFVRQASGVGREASSVTKVVIQR